VNDLYAVVVQTRVRRHGGPVVVRHDGIVHPLHRHLPSIRSTAAGAAAAAAAAVDTAAAAIVTAVTAVTAAAAAAAAAAATTTAAAAAAAAAIVGGRSCGSGGGVVCIAPREQGGVHEVVGALAVLDVLQHHLVGLWCKDTDGDGE
jgi:hypothetical protein